MTGMVARKIASLIVALGVSLSGIGPVWAAPMESGDSMVAMTMTGMPSPCAAAMEQSEPTKQAPAKRVHRSCAVCIACAVNIGFSQGFSPASNDDQVRAFFRDVDRTGIAVLPALPPPILHA